MFSSLCIAQLLWVRLCMVYLCRFCHLGKSKSKCKMNFQTFCTVYKNQNMQIFSPNLTQLYQCQNYVKYCTIMQSYLQLSQDLNRMNSENQKLAKSISEVHSKTSSIESLLRKSNPDQAGVFNQVHHKIIGKETNKEKNELSPEKIPISQSLQIETKRIRKPSQKRFKCPFKECSRLYDTSVSLNLHMKLKHNAGTKKERETLADLILYAVKKGEEPPVAGITLPPDYLEEYRNKKMFKQKYSM